MKIVLAGTGHVAVVLSKKLKAAGHIIVQVFGRNHIAAAVVADKCGATTCASVKDITRQADVYIMAVTDKALTDGAIHLPLKDQLLVHTAGAVPMELLKTMSSSYGVLYPFQTIRKEVEPVSEIPFLVDANSEAAKEKLASLAGSISRTVIFANDQQRLQYHLCAVMTNNFSNYLYVLAEDFCRKNGLKFSALLPLLDETTRRLHHFSPRQVQTGPAIRKDINSIERHLQLLKDDLALQQLYKLFSDAMLKHPW